MAINLWKLGGKPTSYNPLPINWVNRVNMGKFGEFKIKFKAKSQTNAKIHISNNMRNFINPFSLTGEFKNYEFTFSAHNDSDGNLYVFDTDSSGNIIIEDIQLVQKPLPKLTINGIDGFLSGKWTLHANAKVIDDETLELNATADFQISEITVHCLPNTTYTYRGEGLSGAFYTAITNTGMTQVYANGVNNGLITFTTGTGNTISFKTYNGVNQRGKYTFKKPMLNLGSIPAPYSKKTGEKMVLPTPKGNLFNGSAPKSSGFGTPTFADNVLTITGQWYTAYEINVKPNTNLFLSGEASGTRNSTINVWGDSGGSIVIKANSLNGSFNSGSYNKIYLAFYSGSDIVGTSIYKNIMLNEGTTAQPYTPYAVQVNKKPKRYVAKKNLFDGVLESGAYTVSGGVKTDNATYSRNANLLAVKPNTMYLLKVYADITTIRYFFYDINKQHISNVLSSGFSQVSFTTPANCFYVGWFSSATDLKTNIQLEEGTTATPYEPYQQVLPKAKKGLAFNGISDYLQLPSMTMDSIEIDCLIDSVQGSGHYLIDARNGLVNGYVYHGGTGTGISETRVDGVVKTDNITLSYRGQRRKFFIKTNSPFTDDVTLFARGATGLENLKATLYKVTCYLNGAVVAQYDFENPNNIVGDKVLPNAKNLIPSFEDARWSLHSNFKVLGKDVGRLDASASSQWSTIELDVIPNKTYKVVFNNSPNTRIRIGVKDGTSLGAHVGSYYAVGVSDVTFNSTTSTIILALLNDGNAGTYNFTKPQLYELSGKEATLMGKPTPLRKASKRTLYAKR